MRRRGGYVPIYTAVSDYARVINEWSLTQKACEIYEIQKQAPGLQLR